MANASALFATIPTGHSSSSETRSAGKTIAHVSPTARPDAANASHQAIASSFMVSTRELNRAHGGRQNVFSATSLLLITSCLDELPTYGLFGAAVQRAYR
jgi:hypothetical protein